MLSGCTILKYRNFVVFCGGHQRSNIKSESKQYFDSNMEFSSVSGNYYENLSLLVCKVYVLSTITVASLDQKSSEISKG